MPLDDRHRALEVELGAETCRHHRELVALGQPSMTELPNSLIPACSSCDDPVPDTDSRRGHQRGIASSRLVLQTTAMSFLDGFLLFGKLAPRLAGLTVIAFMILWMLNPDLGERLFMALVDQAAKLWTDAVLKAAPG
jgi:hypothetical protein